MPDFTGNVGVTLCQEARPNKGVCYPPNNDIAEVTEEGFDPSPF